MGQLLRVTSSESTVGPKLRVKSETLPGGRFPMPDKNHARLALAMVDRAADLSPEDKAKIKARAHAMLGESAQRKERLTFHPRLMEGATSWDEATRTAQVIIIEVGRGNSRDKHYYGPDTIADAAKPNGPFEGAQAFADHPGLDEDINRPERSVRDLFGYYFDTHATTVKHKDGTQVPALGASLKIQEGADWAIGLIKEAIAYNTRFPDKTYVGISINADGDVAPATVDGEQVNYVHRITEAFSADMVTKPARGGKFLALVESASGASRYSQPQGEAVDTKLIESAATLKTQIATGEIDKDLLLRHLQLVEAAKPDALANGANKPGANGQVLGESGNGKSATDDIKGTTMNESKVKEAFMKGHVAGCKCDGCNKLQEAYGLDEDKSSDATQGTPGHASESDSSGKGSQAMHESNPVFAAALKEARAAVATDVSTLQSKVVTLETREKMRESIDLAKSKLLASKLPAAAATVLMESLVGKSAAEMDRLIEAQAQYLAMLGVTGENSKAIAGNGGSTLALRESETKANQKFIFAGMAGN